MPELTAARWVSGALGSSGLDLGLLRPVQPGATVGSALHSAPIEKSPCQPRVVVQEEMTFSNVLCHL